MGLNKRLLAALLVLLVLLGSVIIAASLYFHHVVNSAEGRKVLRILVQKVVNEYDPELKVRLDGVHCSLDYKITIAKLSLQSSSDKNRTLTLHPVIIDIVFFPYIFSNKLRVALTAEVPNTAAMLQTDITVPLTTLLTGDLTQVEEFALDAKYTAVPLTLLLKFFVHEITLKSIVLGSTDMAANLSGEVTMSGHDGKITVSDITGNMTDITVKLKQQQLTLQFNNAPFKIAVKNRSLDIGIPLSLSDPVNGVDVIISGRLAPIVDMTITANVSPKISALFKFNKGEQPLLRTYQQGNGVVNLIVH